MNLTEQNTETQLTLFQEDFLAKIFLSPVKAKELLGKSHHYGTNTIEVLRKYYLDMHSLKTHLNSQKKDLKKSYMTFPKSGMMQNGKLFSLPNLGNTITGKGFTFLPTPMFKDGEGYYISSKEASLKRINKQIHWIHHGILFYNLNKGIANPVFSEFLMGLPKNWTLVNDLEDVEMQSSEKSQKKFSKL